MKLSKVAAAVAALLATDAKPTEAQIMAACLAADKKGKDEGGLGPVEIENKGKDKKGKDAFPEKDKAEDGNDDPEKTNDEWPEKDKAKDKAKDKDMDGEDEEVDAEDDVQPKKSASGNSGAGGAETTQDKKGMDAAISKALAARDALHAARREVEPVLGVVAYDSASEVYKAALAKLGVAVDGVHPSAYAKLFQMARDKADASAPVMASDASAVQGMAAVIKGYGRL